MSKGTFSHVKTHMIHVIMVMGFILTGSMLNKKVFLLCTFTGNEKIFFKQYN